MQATEARPLLMDLDIDDLNTLQNLVAVDEITKSCEGDSNSWFIRNEGLALGWRGVGWGGSGSDAR